MTPEEALRGYLDLGWVTVGIRADDSRAPVGKGWQQRTEPVRDLKAYRHGAFLVCGRVSGVSVIDLDGQRWFDRFNDLLDEYPTPLARTPSGGAHILVKYSRAPWWVNAVKIAPEIDLRTEGGGIALPMHDPARWWEQDSAPWEQELADPGPYEALLLEIVEECRAEKPSGASGGIPLGSRSMLAGLLANLPQEGERDVWFAHVAGHLARALPFEDAYTQTLVLFNRLLDNPLDDSQVRKVARSIWNREERAAQETATLWTRDGDNLLLVRGKGKTELWLQPEPEVVSTRTNADGEPSWELANGRRRVVIRPSAIHNSQKLSTVLEAIDVKIWANAAPAGANGNLFSTWIRSHDAPQVEEFPHWGWNEGHGWVGLEPGKVGPAGFELKVGQVDRPDIVEQLPTWQEERTAAVFCAWVALQAVKGRVAMSIEPNMVLQGSAGSGKSKGLFAFGARLTGSSRAAVSTDAVLRDRLGSHRNGIVVIDDQSSLEFDEVALTTFRLAATSESRAKNRPGASGQWEPVQIPLLGSLLVSGEGLDNLASDRALRDRSIVLQVPPANERRSLIDPTKAQWVDIMNACHELGAPDETAAHALVGPFVRRLLDAVDRIGEPVIGSGERVEVKLALLQYGARLWQTAYPGSRTDTGKTVPEAVQGWCDDQEQTSGWESLTLVRRIAPALLDQTTGNWSAIRWDKEGHVVLHPERLARAWQQAHRDPRNRELGSISNIRRELQTLADLGMAHGNRSMVMGIGKVRVWTLDERVTERVQTLAGVSWRDFERGQNVSEPEELFPDDDK